MTLVRIVAFEPRHRDAFRDLNLAWITEYFEVEEPDRWLLDDPDAHILRHGGHILMAEIDGEVVGTCALIREDDDTFELAKMAVAPAVRGRGVGRALGAAAVGKAKSLGARRIELLSNTVLEPAIQLYRSLGFVEAPMTPTEYRRANIRMILDLPPSPAR